MGRSFAPPTAIGKCFVNPPPAASGEDSYGLSVCFPEMASVGSSHNRPTSAEDHEERSEEHTSELQSRLHLVCRLLLEKKKKLKIQHTLNHVRRRLMS